MLSGAVANPARQFGTAVLAGHTPFPVVYPPAPPVGSLAATVDVDHLVRTRTRTRRADR